MSTTEKHLARLVADGYYVVIGPINPNNRTVFLATAISAAVPSKPTSRAGDTVSEAVSILARDMPQIELPLRDGSA